MLTRPWCSALVAATALAILLLTALQDCLAQDLSPKSAAQQVIQEKQPPFDKLELFGFFAAGPLNTYADQVIRARGTDFTPDATFIDSFPFATFQEILKNVRPRTVKTISSDRDAAYELLRRAWDAKQNRKFAAASESYQQALQLAPSSATLHLAYAASLLLSQNYPEAEAQARQSIKLWPKNAEAHGLIALALVAQKKFVEAESESREALRIFPEHHSAMFTLGLSLTHEQKYKEAVPVLRNALAAIPKIAAIWKLLGISLVETGEIDGGISQLSLYLKNTPDDAEGHYYLGVALRSRSRTEEARSQFAEAFRLQPNNPQYEAAAHPDADRGATDAVSGPKTEDGSISENVYTNKFFGFTYEFPKGWVSLSSDAARAMVEVGGAFISTGDPTEQDTEKAAARKSLPLLYVVEGRAGNRPISTNSVMLNALDMRAAPGLTPEPFLKSIGQRYKQIGVPIELTGTPQEITIGGRKSWRGDFKVQTAAGDAYVSQFVTPDRGYLLLIVVTSRDLDGLHQIETSLESMHFQDISN